MRYLLSALLLLGAGEAYALGEDVQSLLEYARKHNADLAALRHDVEAAQLRIAPAGALSDPVLRTELFDVTSAKRPSPSSVGSTRYLLSQSLPWYGKRELKTNLASAQAQQAEEESGASWLNLAEKIKSAYAMHFFLYQSEQITRTTLQLLEELEQVARTRYANGIGTQQEVIRAQIELSELQTELLSLQNEKHHLHVNINTLLSRPPGEALADPLHPLPLATALNHAALEDKLNAHNPGLKIASAQLKVAQTNRDISYRNSYPDVTLGIAPNQTGSTVKSWDLMLELSIPLQRESKHAQQREAEELLAASDARAQAVQNQMRADLSENIFEFEYMKQAMTTLDARLLPQAELNLKSAITGYQSGRVDFSTLLDAQKQTLKARQQRVKLEYEARLRLSAIERLTGE